VSQIFEALSVARHRGVDKLKLLSPAWGEPAEGSSELLPAVVVPSNADLFDRFENHTAQLPGKANLSHKKIRNYLILAFFVTGLVLLGTSHAWHPHGSAFADSQSIYGVTFEGTVRPASGDPDHGGVHRHGVQHFGEGGRHRRKGSAAPGYG